MAEHADEVGLGPVIAGLTAPGGEFALETVEVGGMPMRVYRRAPHTLRELWETTAAWPERTFTVYYGERLTYGEHRSLVADLAGRLLDPFGLRRGDRVAIAMRNVPEWPVAFFAAQVAGLVVVPLNAWWSAAELAWAVADSGARVVVADPERTEALTATWGADPAGAVPVVRVRGTGPQAPPGVVEWASLGLRTDGPGSVDDLPAPGPDDVATILYTSGTTGRPKGAVGTHRNHVTNLHNVALQARATALQSADVRSASSLSGAEPPAGQQGTLLMYPMFHIAGINGLVGAVLAGSKLATLHRWDPEQARAVVRSERLTRSNGVPSTTAELLDGADPQDLASLRTFGMGGAPVPPELVTRIGRELGAGVANGYGLTETTSAICANTGSDYAARPDSVGRPAPGAELRIAGPSGEPLPDGEIGELWFRGPNIVRGYWNDPDADAAAFVDGWFRSGDLGHVTDGWVYVVDRLKDVVLRGGENVYSAQVEAAIHAVPGVVEVAVYGVPHPRLGEEVAALVRGAPGADRDDDAVRAAVADRVGTFAVPAHVAWTGEPLPRTATGKIRKRELRDAFPG
ncbi:class I adenylate-forming enzyme family protein [Pseudonocardia parietis]|uniref:Acyl-CoA synthetase (AMP-forming)/AMP-acid ligase II n=1 Tax=Pseudonocardia parietis TaxID=570936 RepID=A0ABS4VW34_9PSEU|nr:class I adenylate-forming enzyme family protein [Pseudonocardia parietis]MBP2368119.1 acyl-CoA synthetase (AMP-forming)/AMP-acid ligase II [Pseudonocardia parietis]